VKVERNVGDGGVVKGGPSSDFVKCSGGVCEDWGGRVPEYGLGGQRGVVRAVCQLGWRGS